MDARMKVLETRRLPGYTSVALLALALGSCAALVRGEPHCGNQPHRVSTIKALGGRMDWSRANDLIAYDRLGDNPIYYDVYVMSPDGTGNQCLTCGKAGLVPQRNNGNPAWHPSGDYIVFQSEVAASRVTPYSSNPGRGINNVLWVTDPSGRNFYQLTTLSTSDPVSGVLHAHFSPDGTRLSWSEIYEESAVFQAGTFYGHWRLVVADFTLGVGGRPVLSNIRKFEPGGPAFYENHGFSPDGSRLIFSSNLVYAGWVDGLNSDIFLLDLETQALTRLTDEGYNEHAHFFPDGNKIAWITNKDSQARGTELWMMNADGTGKERLTFFSQPGCPEYNGTPRAAAADNAINAAGNKILVYVQDESFGDIGSIELVELDYSP